MKESISRYFAIALGFLVSGCVTVPEGITPVNDFNLERYLGTWYEIARLDHSFERGMEQVTATYTLKNDGSVDVFNRGYLTEDGEWDDANGTAKMVADAQTGHLKVSFFGPFYASYVIFELDDDNYNYAFVTGPNRDFLWFLSRTPQVDEALKAQFLERVDQLGFDTKELVWVNQPSS